MGILFLPVLKLKEAQSGLIQIGMDNGYKAIWDNVGWCYLDPRE